MAVSGTFNNPTSPYQNFSMHQPTAELETGTDNAYEFQLAPNRNLYIIEKHATGSHHTEVHVLTAASNYTAFSMHQPTAELETGTDSSYVFLLASNLDLFIIEKHATGSHHTEVHVLTAASNYTAFSMHQPTAELETGTDSSYVFLLASNLDLFIIEKHATGSHHTEVHVLTAASNYTAFSMHQPTAELETGTDSSYVFLLASNLDLFIIEKHATGSHHTEVHVLTAASNYTAFSMHQPTAELETGTDSSYVFLLASNLDLFIIEKHATGSHHTEVHVLTA